MITEHEPALIACTECGETGRDSSGSPCPHCQEGYWELKECPRRFIGPDLTDAINLAQWADKGVFPVEGGTLKQTSWFLDLVGTLKAEDAAIDRERLEQMKNGK